MAESGIKYPVFMQDKSGVKVQVSATVLLPGVYLTRHRAEKAANQYYTRVAEMQAVIAEKRASRKKE